MSDQFEWTEAMVEELKRLLLDPECPSYLQIANALAALSGRPLTRNAISGKIDRMGLAGLRSHTARSAIVKWPKREGRRVRMSSNPTAPPVAEPPPPPLLNCSLLDLRPNSCRWPIALADNGEHLFCGVVKPVEHSYCPDHASRAYTPQRSGRR